LKALWAVRLRVLNRCVGVRSWFGGIRQGASFGVPGRAESGEELRTLHLRTTQSVRACYGQVKALPAERRRGSATGAGLSVAPGTFCKRSPRG
jgi:hypothetical protein